MGAIMSTSRTRSGVDGKSPELLPTKLEQSAAAAACTAGSSGTITTNGLFKSTRPSPSSFSPATATATGKGPSCPSQRSKVTDKMAASVAEAAAAASAMAVPRDADRSPDYKRFRGVAAAAAGAMAAGGASKGNHEDRCDGGSLPKGGEPSGDFDSSGGCGSNGAFVGGHGGSSFCSRLFEVKKGATVSTGREDIEYDDDDDYSAVKGEEGRDDSNGKERDMNGDDTLPINDDSSRASSDTNSSHRSSSSIASFLRRPFFGSSGGSLMGSIGAAASIGTNEEKNRGDGDPTLLSTSNGNILETIGSNAVVGALGSKSTVVPRKDLGHIGDGRRLLGAQPRPQKEAKKNENAEKKMEEMPIQMMTAHSGARKQRSGSDAGSSDGNGKGMHVKHLNREVRGLLEGSGSNKENVAPTFGGTTIGSHRNKPTTRSKTRQLQKTNLLQEHPSVRANNGNNNAKGSRGGKKTGGRISLGGSKGKGRAQAASPAPTSKTVTSSSHPSGIDVAPTTLTINGYNVTMIDQERKVFVIDLVSPETCDKIRTMTDDYVRIMSETNPGKQTWRTLYTYTKMDLPCGEVTNLNDTCINGIMEDVISIVGKVYSKEKEAAKLRPRSWKEPHLLHYQVLDGKPSHTGIEMHYDGCDITWSLMLSGSGEYEGGGTYIRCLRRTIMLEQGQVLIHPGELYHKGNPITGGTRSMVVCFLDGFDPKLIDSSRAAEDKPEYADYKVYS